MTKEKMEYSLFMDSDYTSGGNDISSNFYYNIQGLLPVEYKKYYVKIESIMIQHTYDDTAGYINYIPLNSTFYRVMINFDKGYNIYSNDNYVEMFIDKTIQYVKTFYFDNNANSVENIDFLNIPCIKGRNGPEVLINRPKNNTIHVQILDDTGNNITNLGGTDLEQHVKILLKFTPFIED